MARKVFDNHMVAHVWAAQSQGEGRSANSNFFFHQGTIYSYRTSRPLAHIMPEETWQEGNRLIIINRDSYSVSTSRHLRYVDSATHSTDEQITATCKALEDYTIGGGLEADRRQALFAAIINQRVEALLARAKALSNTRKAAFRDGDDTEARRIASLTDEEVQRLRFRFNVDAVLIKAYDLEAMHDAIRAAFAKANDPKRVKARERNAQRSSLTKLRGMAKRFKDGETIRGYRTANIARANVQADAVIVEALRTFPDEASRVMAEVQSILAMREADMTHERANPDASAIRWQRRYGSREHKAITAAQWEAGAKGTPSGYLTLVRREGDELVTSRGARVPFKRAIAAFLLAQGCRADGSVWTSPPNHAFPIGAFRLDSIDAEGTLRAGCHTIGFETMLRLAIREVPHLVKARYPLPALVNA